MRVLFNIDLHNYDPAGKAFVRPSVRAVIIRNGRIGLVYSKLYQYYKFPGGGLNSGETNIEALVREVREETGLSIIPARIREYGYVRRIQKGDFDPIFVQNNYYFFCEVHDEIGEQKLDDYEAEEGFELRWVEASEAIETNKLADHAEADAIMIERDTRVLELLMEEGHLR